LNNFLESGHVFYNRPVCIIFNPCGNAKTIQDILAIKCHKSAIESYRRLAAVISISNFDYR